MSGLDDLRRLRDRWYLRPGHLRESVDTLERSLGFDDDWVTATLASVPRRPTEVKDAVWGMVPFDPRSRVLLDWPMLQRLRFVRQLGLSYLVYPTAEHSRFTHCIGVYHSTLQLLEHASRTAHGGPLAGAPTDVQIPDAMRVDVLHAALLHDLGHLPFSHATEQAFQTHRSIATCGRQPLQQFLSEAEHHLRATRGLAELLSAALLLSPRFGRLYGGLREEAEGEPALRVAALVLGLPADQRWPGVAGMISGQVDADKIDYLRRDSLHCNVPIGLDPSRLFLRTSLLRMEAGTARPDQTTREVSEVHFAVNASGTDAIEEITEARVRMYRRVYQHRVTLANEATLTAGLGAAMESNAAAFDAVALLGVGDQGLLQALDGATPSRPWARRLLLRRPLKRAAAFGNLVADDLGWVQDALPALSSATLDELRAAATNKEFGGLRMDRKARTLPEVTELRGRIITELAHLRALPELRPHLPPDTVTPDVAVLPIPRAPEPGGADPYVLFPDGRVSLASQTSTQIQRILAGHLYDALGYVVCAREWRCLVHYATLRALLGSPRPEVAPHQLVYSSGGAPTPPPSPSETAPNAEGPGRTAHPPMLTSVHVEQRWRVAPDRVVSRCRLPTHDLAEVRVALEGAGWFDACPAAAEPVSEVPVPTRTFQDYRGDGGWRVTRSLVVKWLSQFPPSLRDAAAELLREVVFLDGERTGALLGGAVASASFQGAVHAAPFGRGSGPAVRQRTLRGSGSWLPAGATEHASVTAALQHAKPGDSLLIYDDWTLSGSQAVAQWLAWGGTGRDEWPVELRGEQEIDETPLGVHRGSLASLDVHHCFAVAEPAGANRILAHLTGTGLVGSVAVHSGAPAPRVDWARFSGLRDFLTDVGTETLTWCRRPGATPDPDGPTLPAPGRDTAADALGYGGLAHLCVSPTNCPSSALTALWCPGRTRRGPWVPLFLRQRYLRHLVI